MKSLSVLLLLIGLQAYYSYAAITVTNVDRELDISTQLVGQVKEQSVFTFQSTESVTTFEFAVEQDVAPKVAWIEGSVDSKPLKAPVVEKIGDKGVVYKFALASAVKGEGKIQIDVQLAHAVSPFPTHISQAEQQLVEYKGSALVFSPYAVKSQKTTVKLASSKVEHFTKVAPSKTEGDSIVYGPYESTEPFAKKAVRVHFENNAPFVVVTRLERLIEVSHWGNVAVEEQIELEHQGAKLKGAFSRFDYQRDHRGQNQPSVASFKTLLPASARDVYYRDEIGNISTSHMRQHDDAVELIIRPRFPLFGGWRTHYTLGYNVPSYEYLFASGNQYTLKMRFIDHIFDDMVIDEVTTKIMLPERSDKIKLNTPYKVRRSADGRHATYLDYVGRPVLIAHKTLLTEKHINTFELSYTFDRTSMLYEPLMIVVAFYVLFFVVIVWVRLDFTIAKDEVSESRLRVQGMVEKVADAHAQRLQTYDQYMEAASMYTQNKDATTFNSKKKRLEGELKTNSEAVTALQQDIKAENADCADKLSELQRIYKQTLEVLTNYSLAAEKAAKGGAKALFADTDKKLRKQLEEARDKMDAIVYAL